MPKLNTKQTLFIFYVIGLFMGQFTPITGGLIGLLMLVLGWKELIQVK